MKKIIRHIIVEKNFIIAILVLWCIFTFRMLNLQVKGVFKNFPRPYSLSLEQKYKLIDGNFYDFTKFCESNIPERASVMFKVVPKAPDFLDEGWLIPEYFISKSSYYLYPRKIFREKDATPGIRYQIIYDFSSKTFNLYYQ